MGKTTWLLGEAEVTVNGFFTTHHQFQTEMGTEGEFTFPAFAQHGVFRTADGRELLMQKTHWLGTVHELIEGDTVRGTADRAGLFRRDIVIHLDGQEYRLEPAGLFSQDWLLTDAEGVTLMEIQPRGVFKQGAYLIITMVVDIDLVAFAYYLYHMRNQEEAAAVSATAAS